MPIERCRRRIPFRWAAGLLLAAFLNGCYTFAPVGTETPNRATQMRVFLSSPRDIRLTRYTVNNVTEVDGELVSLSDSTVVLSVGRVVAQSGDDELGNGETVSLPRAQVASLERKKVSVLRSLIVVAGVAIVAVLAGVGFSQGGASSQPGGGGGQSK